MRIIYFDLDCCRADHLVQYGYHRNTSPNIDRISQNGVTFTNCFTSNSPCLPSRAALFSGRFGIHNGVVAHHGIGEQFRSIWYSHSTDMKKPLLQHYLWSKGMKTVSFSCFHDRHNAWWFCSGWEELHTFTRKRGQETADEVNDACIPWIHEYVGEDNWFLHIHYWDIHSHYRINEEWANRFAKDPPPDWPDQKAIDAH